MRRRESEGEKETERDRQTADRLTERDGERRVGYWRERLRDGEERVPNCVITLHLSDVAFEVATYNGYQLK